MFHQLDITDRESIVKLRDFLHGKYNGLDVLINNAGMAYKVGNNTGNYVLIRNGATSAQDTKLGIKT